MGIFDGIEDAGKGGPPASRKQRWLIRKLCGLNGYYMPLVGLRTITIREASKRIDKLKGLPWQHMTDDEMNPEET